MKIGVSLYSFHGYKDKLGYKGCIDKVVEFGGQAIDISEGPAFAAQEEHLDFARDINAYCKQVGIEMGCYCVGSDFINGSGGDIEAEIERVKTKVDLAEAYGFKLIRHDATYGYNAAMKHSRGFDNALPRLVKGYREVTEYAAAKGIKTCIGKPRLFRPGRGKNRKADKRRRPRQFRGSGGYRQLLLRRRIQPPFGGYRGSLCLPRPCQGLPHQVGQRRKPRRRLLPVKGKQLPERLHNRPRRRSRQTVYCRP